MTLVVGMHLGDSVGVVADSRVTFRYPDGRRKYLDNALKVYTCPPYFVAAIAGDALAGTGFINSLSLRLITACTHDEVFRRATDLDWMREMMLLTYESDLRNRLLEETQKFACVFAMENRARIAELGEVPRTVSLPPSVADSSFESSAQQLARGTLKGGELRAVFSVRFPSAEVQEAEPGEALYVGSGSKAARDLSTHATVMVPPPDMSHGDRLAAVAIDISCAQRFSGDASFNGIYFGMSLSCGVPEVILHTFNHWPTDSASKSEYAWEDYHFDDVPETTYSAGLDVAELNTGWIYDGERRKRMKLQSYLDPEFIDAHVRRRSSSGRLIL